MQNAAINSESVSAEPVKVSDPLDVCMYGERFLARYYGDVGQFEHMSIKALAAIYTGLSRVIDVFLDVANQPRVKKWEKGSYATDWNMTQADRFCEMRTALVMHVKRRTPTSDEEFVAMCQLLVVEACECGEAPEDVIALCHALESKRPKKS